MSKRIALSLSFVVSLGWACDTSSEGLGVLDAGTNDDAASLDGAQGFEAAASEAGDAASTGDATADGAPDVFFPPPLGLYTVNTDGGGLELLLDAGSRELSHVRAGPGNGWLVATRYGQDPDNNGLSMENEVAPGDEVSSAHYGGTEIVTFQRSAPYAQTVVAGTTDGGVAANASWTEDEKVIFLENAPGAPITSAHLARVSFSTVPQVSSIATVPVPTELFVPVDPHQVGPSDGTGKVSFSATVNLAGNVLRPVWVMPANGTASMASVSFVGCPICPAQNGCCGWPNPDDILGTNDSRMSHSGGDIMWMQQSPNISATIGTDTFNPYRQSMRPLDGGAQVDLVAPGTAATTSLTFGEWRPDDQELVYWSIQLDANQVLRQYLWLMNRDGTNRRQIPLPRSLCPLHPSYLSTGEIVFNAWRGATADDSCDVSHL